jgi:uncharacterized repeat protein (TIGR03803 family)
MRDNVFIGAIIMALSLVLTACDGGVPQQTSWLESGSKQSSPDEPYKVLHTFRGSPGDGSHSTADLIDVKGTLYGTTVTGGKYRYGTFFSITTGGKETVLHNFGSPYDDGLNPEARLLNVNGTLYGTTVAGGANGGGTVFSMSLDGTEKVLRSFDYPYSNPQKGGDGPEAGLINIGSTLYGTTANGGAVVCGGDAYLCGTVFSITTSGKNFRVLHSFGRTNNDAASPAAALVNVNGTLYGTTTGGGRYDLGAVFSITTNGKEHVLCSLGSSSYSALIDVDGALYGTTSGDGQGGTVFSVTTDGTLKTIFSFNGSDGSAPLADLKNVKGVLYGTTSMGGVNNAGTVFKITKGGREAVLHSFGDVAEGSPQAGLLAVAGILYGTASGGVNGDGSIFSLAP